MRSVLGLLAVVLLAGCGNSSELARVQSQCDALSSRLDKLEERAELPVGRKDLEDYFRMNNWVITGEGDVTTAKSGAVTVVCSGRGDKLGQIVLIGSFTDQQHVKPSAEALAALADTLTPSWSRADLIAWMDSAYKRAGSDMLTTMRDGIDVTIQNAEIGQANVHMVSFSKRVSVLKDSSSE